MVTVLLLAFCLTRVFVFRFSYPATDNVFNQIPLGSSSSFSVGRPKLPPCISISTFCRAFPYHVIFDREMNLLQLGVAFLRVVGHQSAAGLSFSKKSGRRIRASFNQYFHIISPHNEENLEVKFSWILKFVNQPFAVLVKGLRRNSSIVEKQQTHLEVSV